MTPNFLKHVDDLFASMRDCLGQQRILPCLTLLYTGIDLISCLESDEGYATRAQFVNWVDRYILDGRTFDCTALDLYAARCGVVHTFRPDSILFSQGKARKVAYSWGGEAHSERLKAATLALDIRDTTYVHINDFINAFAEGLASYLEDVSRVPIRRQSVEANLAKWFVNLDPAVMDIFIRATAPKAERSEDAPPALG